MIQEVPAYQCVCDKCQKVIEFGEGWTFFKERTDLQDWIDNETETMTVKGGKHICYDCIEPYDDSEIL